MDLWHWLQHFSGADDPSGHWYTFWSGFGADIGEIALLGAVIGTYRKHNCHVHRCWRIAKQDIEGTSWKVCHRHHPLGKPTVADIQAHHVAWEAGQATRNAALVEAVEAGARINAQAEQAEAEDDDLPPPD